MICPLYSLIFSDLFQPKNVLEHVCFMLQFCLQRLDEVIDIHVRPSPHVVCVLNFKRLASANPVIIPSFKYNGVLFYCQFCVQCCVIIFWIIIMVPWWSRQLNRVCVCDSCSSS